MRNSKPSFGLLAVLTASLAASSACKSEEKPADTAKPAEAEKPAEVAKPEQPKAETKPAQAAALPEPPLGLKDLPTPSPEDNPTTAEKVALGEMLFFDPRMSDSGKFACLTCHLPEKGWTDGQKLSTKADGKVNTRHSPTMYNVGYAQDFYWDGRIPSLEAQVAAAWKGQTGATPDKIAATLAQVPKYVEMFQAAFGEAPTPDNIAKALAAFLRVKMRAGDAPWDRYQAGEKDAVPEEVVKGYEVFVKSGCAACHGPPLYTDMAYHNIGVGYKDVKEPDPGRFTVSKNERDTGAFKTPTLRGVALSAPYFHDGSAATLEEAVDFMLAGGYREGNKHIDPLLKPVKISDEERSHLVAFLKALTPETEYTPPTLP